MRSLNLIHGICYQNTKTTIPGWINNLHIDQPLGYAYETTTHFVHFYGNDIGFNIISLGLTTIEKKSGTLEDWVIKTFGAQNIKTLTNSIGSTIDGIWRPSLYYEKDIQEGILSKDSEQRSSEQALRILIEKLDEIFLYIEPDNRFLSSYGHKTRELLILACTEVENQWTALLNKANVSPVSGKHFKTNDYVKVRSAAFLEEYLVLLKGYPNLNPYRPFASWNSANPTTSLTWYDAYNKTKHDRHSSFDESSLENTINAVIANVIMFCVRFGPFALLDRNNSLSSLVNQNFQLSLDNSKIETYYIPSLNLPQDVRTDLFIYNSYEHRVPWIVSPLSV